MHDFTYVALPARVVFGNGTLAALPAELARLGIARPLIVTTQGQEKAGTDLMTGLDNAAAGVFSGALMHTPAPVTQDALRVFKASQADGVIALGGGSTIGLSKAIALHTNAPQIAIPTTYAGSEMTPILGQTDAGRKVTQSTLRVLPETVIYDVELTLSLPKLMSVTSGLNAVAHAIEAMYSQSANPMLDLAALEGVRALTSALPRICEHPEDVDARSDALYGAWTCATCLGLGGVALHHKLCHVIGGGFDLPHAQTHAIVLPHALGYNAPTIPNVMRQLEVVMESNDVPGTLFDIAHNAGAPTALRDLGMPENGIITVVEQTLANPYPNPRALEREALHALLQSAWSGERPT